MLPGLVDFPNLEPTGIDTWALWHVKDHEEIRQQIQVLYGINLNKYQIYPVDMDHWQEFSLQHQQYHNDMNSVTGLAGTDLTDVDFKDDQKRKIWSFNHFVEHRQIRELLEI